MELQALKPEGDESTVRCCAQLSTAGLHAHALVLVLLA